MVRIAFGFAVVAAILLLVFAGAERYAERTVLQRFCADKAGVIKRVGLIVTKSEPVGEGAKRPFVVAARLVFLIPQRQSESVSNYLARLRRHLDKEC